MPTVSHGRRNGDRATLLRAGLSLTFDLGVAGPGGYPVIFDRLADNPRGRTCGGRARERPRKPRSFSIPWNDRCPSDLRPKREERAAAAEFTALRDPSIASRIETHPSHVTHPRDSWNLCRPRVSRVPLCLAGLISDRGFRRGLDRNKPCLVERTLASIAWKRIHRLLLVLL